MAADEIPAAKGTPMSTIASKSRIILSAALARLAWHALPKNEQSSKQAEEAILRAVVVILNADKRARVRFMSVAPWLPEFEEFPAEVFSLFDRDNLTGPFALCRTEADARRVMNALNMREAYIDV
jgi:hypothetical protein